MFCSVPEDHDLAQGNHVALGKRYRSLPSQSSNVQVRVKVRTRTQKEGFLIPYRHRCLNADSRRGPRNSSLLQGVSAMLFIILPQLWPPAHPLEISRLADVKEELLCSFPQKRIGDTSPLTTAWAVILDFQMKLI